MLPECHPGDFLEGLIPKVCLHFCLMVVDSPSAVPVGGVSEGQACAGIVSVPSVQGWLQDLSLRSYPLFWIAEMLALCLPALIHSTLNSDLSDPEFSSLVCAEAGRDGHGNTAPWELAGAGTCYGRH